MNNANTVMGVVVGLCLFYVASGTLTAIEVPTHQSASLVRGFDTGVVYQTPSVPATSTGRLLFVGDVMLARDVEQKSLQLGVGYPYGRIQPFFDSHEYIIANFEAAIPEIHVPTPAETLSFSVALPQVEALMASGVTHVSLANNHSLDKGVEGYEYSVATLEAQGIVPFGGLATETAITRLSLGVHEVGVVAIDVTSNDFEPASYQEILSQLRADTDLQVVYIHWGEEYASSHNESQAALAHWFVDLGADLVIGHHPHVIQDIEIYKDVPIIYSLGNFIFDQYFDEAVQTGLVVTLEGNELPTIILEGVTSIDAPASPRLLQFQAKTELLESIAKESAETARPYILDGTMTLPVSLAN